MPKRHKLLAFAWFLLFLLASLYAPVDRTFAYEIDVHDKLTERAYLQASTTSINRFLKDLGINPDTLLDGRNVPDWMREGSIFEDGDPPRSLSLRPLNHFYDPVTRSGLTILGVPLGTDAINWALELRLIGTLTQDYSIEDAKDYLYTGITGVSKWGQA